MPTCDLCKRESGKLRVLKATPQDQAHLKKMGEENPKSEYGFCPGCVEILSNQQSALALMKGMVVVSAKQQGMSPEAAERAAGKYVGKLAKAKIRS